MPAKKESLELVQVGDRIYLEAEDRSPETGALRFLSVDANTSSLLSGLSTSAISTGNGFWAHATFVVYMQSSWTHLQAYKTLLEQTGISEIEARTHVETRNAYKQVLVEREHIEEEFKRAQGRELRYGSIIQLKHDSLETFLSSSRETAGWDGGTRMVLDINAGQSGLFRIKPRLRVHNEGDRVRAGDPIVLEVVETGNRVTLSTTGQMTSGVRSVLQAPRLVSVEPSTHTGSAASFRPRIYRSFLDEKQSGELQCDKPCTLFHREAEAFLSCSASPVKQGGRITISCNSAGNDAEGSGASVQAECASTAIWQVQNEDSRRGSIAYWGDRFRLRHTVSSRYLAVSSRIDSAKSGEYACTLVSAVHSQEEPEDTLFEFLPQYRKDGASAIYHSHLLRIRHVKSQSYLHMRPLTSTPSPLPSRARAVTGTNAGGAQTSEQTKDVRLELVATRFSYDQAMFTIHEVQMHQLKDLQYILSTTRPLQSFLRDVRRVALKLTSASSAVTTFVDDAVADEEITAVFATAANGPRNVGRSEPAMLHLQSVVRTVSVDAASTSSDVISAARGYINFAPVLDALTDFIRFVTESDNMDPYTREGIPQPRRQRMLAELQVLHLAISCIRAPFDAGLYNPNDLDRRQMANAPPDVHAMRSVAVLAMRLVRHSLREHVKNKNNALSLVPSLLHLLPCSIVRALRHPTRPEASSLTCSPMHSPGSDPSLIFA